MRFLWFIIVGEWRGGEEGVRDFKCWLDLLFDDGWTLQESPLPPFYDKVLNASPISLKALDRFCF
jgi:hypothetical protein